jgi:hypothetical protein
MENRYVVFRYTSGRLIRDLSTRSGGRLRVVDTRSAYLPLDGQAGSPEGVREAVKSLLQAG